MVLSVNAIHPMQRVSASPAEGSRVWSNPPPLLWPAEEGKTVRYSVRLSQSSRFPKRSTVQADGLRWALFNPHRKLPPGTWYWQYGVSKRGRAPVWSEVFAFEISRSARVSETPTAAEMVAACPEAHPRLWLTSEEVDALRRRLKGSEEAARFARQAETYLGEELADDAEPPPKGESEYQVRTYRRWASKALAGNIAGSMQWLVPAYLMTGDGRFGREAVRRGVHVAGWDPDRTRQFYIDNNAGLPLGTFTAWSRSGGFIEGKLFGLLSDAGPEDCILGELREGPHQGRAARGLYHGR